MRFSLSRMTSRTGSIKDDGSSNNSIHRVDIGGILQDANFLDGSPAVERLYHIQDIETGIRERCESSNSQADLVTTEEPLIIPEGVFDH